MVSIDVTLNHVTYVSYNHTGIKFSKKAVRYLRYDVCGLLGLLEMFVFMKVVRVI